MMTLSCPTAGVLASKPLGPACGHLGEEAAIAIATAGKVVIAVDTVVAAAAAVAAQGLAVVAATAKVGRRMAPL